MKFITNIPAFIAASALWIISASWSQKGHDVTSAIAEAHLTPRTVAALDSILDGKSIIYWANWLDNASHTPEFAYSKTWHYLNVDPGERFDTRRMNPDGDALTAIEFNIGVLRDPTSSKDDKALALKMLVHIMGDIHQPMHMGHASDLGGNLVKVKYFGQDKNLHSLWDGSLVESAHKWSYSEWREQIDRVTPGQMQVIISGNPEDWARATYLIARDVYDYFPEKKQISYGHVAYWAPIIEQQLLFGGLRLAHTLNGIFDPDYTPDI